MFQRLKAVYHEGAFVPQEPCDVPEGSELELIIQGSSILPPEVREPKQRMHILKTVVQRMRQNPIPAETPRLTREALHERC